MHEPCFDTFRKDLRRAGIAPRHAKRAVLELSEHYEDLVSACRDQGLDASAARRKAAEQIGSMDDVITAMRAQPELLVWSHRYPRVAVVAYPLACLALIPAIPVFAGVTHASTIARWSACFVLGGLVTTLILAVLQLSIALA